MMDNSQTKLKHVIAFFSTSDQAGVSSLALRTAWLAAESGRSTMLMKDNLSHPDPAADKNLLNRVKGRLGIRTESNPYEPKNLQVYSSVAQIRRLKGPPAELAVLDCGKVSEQDEDGLKRLIGLLSGGSAQGFVVADGRFPVEQVGLARDLAHRIEDESGELPRTLINGGDPLSPPQLLSSAIDYTPRDPHFNNWVNNPSARRRGDQRFKVDPPMGTHPRRELFWGQRDVST